MERARALGPTNIEWRTCHTPSTQQEEANNSGVFVLMVSIFLIVHLSLVKGKVERICNKKIIACLNYKYM